VSAAIDFVAAGIIAIEIAAGMAF